MSSVIRRFWSVIDLVLVVAMGAMIAIVFANVVMRYGFSSGIRQSVELARLGFVWIVLLGSVVALRQDEHLALSEFSERYFPRAVPFLRRLCWLVVILCMVMFFIGSWHQTAANWSNFSQVTGLPSALFYLAGVVSALLMGAVAVVRFFDPTPYSEKQGQNA